MKGEFEVVVTEAMRDAEFTSRAGAVGREAVIEAALAHEDFQRQLRAWAAEEMRGLVPEGATMSMHGTATAVYAWDSCRAETLANIEKWESSNGQ